MSSLPGHDVYAIDEDETVNNLKEKIKFFKPLATHSRKKSNFIAKEINDFTEKECVSILSIQGRIMIGSVLLRSTPQLSYSVRPSSSEKESGSSKHSSHVRNMSSVATTDVGKP